MLQYPKIAFPSKNDRTLCWAKWHIPLIRLKVPRKTRQNNEADDHGVKRLAKTNPLLQTWNSVTNMTIWSTKSTHARWSEVNLHFGQAEFWKKQRLSLQNPPFDIQGDCQNLSHLLENIRKCSQTKKQQFRISINHLLVSSGPRENKFFTPSPTKFVFLADRKIFSPSVAC